MTDVAGVLERWALDVDEVRARMYEARTPRERERWHALWLLAQGWPAARVAAALGRDPHTVGAWLARFRHDGPAALAATHSGGAPPPSAPRSGPP
jgi:transposase